MERPVNAPESSIFVVLGKSRVCNSILRGEK
jgi:hypothetical protein